MSVSTTLPDTTPKNDLISATRVFYYLLIPALVLWYIYWRISRRHMLKLAEKIPGPKGLPIVGNALQFVGTSS
ncbi:hypothetical protein ILUMI_17322, partial [Ignelater luminosus]